MHRAFRWLPVLTAVLVILRAGMPAALAGERFDVLEFVVEGNTVLDTIAVERAVYPFLGPQRSIDDVEAARQALEAAFQKAGYLTVLVNVPEQQVKDGVVRLDVVEGEVERLRVKGARFFSAGRIRAAVPSMAEGSVPYFPDVQEQLGRLAGNPDRVVTPVLRPGQVPGRVEVDLNVADKRPLHGTLDLNNRFSADTEELRMLGSVRYDNLWQRGHSASLQALVTPQDPSQVRVFTGTYVFQPGGGRNVLALYGVRSNSDVAAAGSITVVGKGSIAGARYIVPLASRMDLNHSFTLGMDYKSFTDALTLIGADTLTTPISYVPNVVQYSASRNDASGVTQGSASASFALRGLFGNRDQEFANRRFDARSNYLFWRAEISREQVLPRRASVYARVSGQSSTQPLISTEQFFAGGVDSVRGYLEAEALGDDALAARIEGRSPSLGALIGRPDTELRVHAFFDAAEVRIQNPLPGQQARFRLSSVGLGFRAKALQSFAASMDLAWPLESTQRTQAGQPRLHFRVAYDF